MKILISTLVFTACLAGCAGSPIQLSQMDRDQLSSVPNEQLIHALGNNIYRNELMLKEARSRGLITDDEIQLIKNKKIKIGMSETALTASWGYPSKINRSVGSYGTHKQFVYGTYSRYSTPTYVYVENGKVRSWQD